MTLEDLKEHSTTPVTPISINYGGEKGVTLHETPPNGQGLTALIGKVSSLLLYSSSQAHPARLHTSTRYYRSDSRTRQSRSRKSRTQFRSMAAHPHLCDPTRLRRYSRLRRRSRTRSSPRRRIAFQSEFIVFSYLSPLRQGLVSSSSRLYCIIIMVDSLTLRHFRRSTFESEPNSSTPLNRVPSSIRAHLSPLPTPSCSQLPINMATPAPTSNRITPVSELSLFPKVADSRFKTEDATLHSKKVTRTALPRGSVLTIRLFLGLLLEVTRKAAICSWVSLFLLISEPPTHSLTLWFLISD